MGAERLVLQTQNMEVTDVTSDRAGLRPGRKSAERRSLAAGDCPPRETSPLNDCEGATETSQGKRSGPETKEELLYPKGNADTECVIRPLKEDLVWPREFDSVQAFEAVLKQWVKDYNEDFPHSALNYETPCVRTVVLCVLSK